MNERTRRSDADGRMSIEQKIHLIEYMEDHSDFARGKFIGVEGKITLRNMWEILAEQLNGLGPRKTADKWKRAWFDLKTKTKRKAAMTRKLRVQTGGGSPPTPLTDLDEKLIKIITEEAVFGLQTEDVVLESEEPMQHSFVASTLTTSQAPHISDKGRPSTSHAHVDVKPTPATSQALNISVRHPSNEPTPSTLPADDHDYCSRHSDNNYIMLTDEEETGSRASTPSCSTISPAPGCSSDPTPSSRRKNLAKFINNIEHAKGTYKSN